MYLGHPARGRPARSIPTSDQPYVSVSGWPTAGLTGCFSLTTSHNQAHKIPKRGQGSVPAH